MDYLGHERAAGPRLPLEQHRRLGGRRAASHLAHGGRLRGLADEGEPRSRPLPELPGLAPEPPLLQGALQRRAGPRRVRGLEDVGLGTGAERVDGHVERVPGATHHEGRVRAPGAGLGDERRGAPAGRSGGAEDAVVGEAPERRQPGLGGGRVRHVVAAPAQRGEHVCAPCRVGVHDEDAFAQGAVRESNSRTEPRKSAGGAPGPGRAQRLRSDLTWI